MSLEPPRDFFMRTTTTENVLRLLETQKLLEEGCNSAQTAAYLAGRFNVSVRQARRYVKSALTQGVPVKAQDSLLDIQTKPMGCCYVIQHIQTGLFKIGCSQRWEHREFALGVGTLCRLITIWEGTDFKDREALLHKKLAAYRLPASEWFFCELTDIRF